jgi:hypothetical protein
MWTVGAMFLETLLKCTGKDRSDTFWTSLAIRQLRLMWTVGAMFLETLLKCTGKDRSDTF